MKPRHESTNVVIHDWRTTDRVCERCSGTIGKLEQTPDPNVQLYRCWCGKVVRIEKLNLLDEIRSAVTAYRDTPARQAHLLMSRRLLEAVLRLPVDEQPQAVTDVLSLASQMGLGLPVLLFVPESDEPVAKINADRTIDLVPIPHPRLGEPRALAVKLGHDDTVERLDDLTPDEADRVADILGL